LIVSSHKAVKHRDDNGGLRRVGIIATVVVMAIGALTSRLSLMIYGHLSPMGLDDTVNKNVENARSVGVADNIQAGACARMRPTWRIIFTRQKKGDGI